MEIKNKLVGTVLSKKMIALYIFSCVIVLAGAVNVGVSRYVMAIPFMALLLWISKTKFKSGALYYFSLGLIGCSVLVSHTQTHNPLLFPILQDGYVEILQDGYQQSFTLDGSGSFTLTKELDTECISCGEVLYYPVRVGERYPVRAVRVYHPDFGTVINLVTDIGEFHQYDYEYDPYIGQAIATSKPVHASWADWLGGAMVWPLLVVYPATWFVE